MDANGRIKRRENDAKKAENIHRQILNNVMNFLNEIYSLE